MITVPKSRKCCATCANWAGERRAVNNGTSAETQLNDRGACYAGVFSGVTQGTYASEGTSCNKYQPWTAINR